MNHPGRERRRRREQLRRARRKLDERQISAEGRAGDGNRQSEREWRDLVEGRIQDAMAAGAFDNLPGERKAPVQEGATTTRIAHHVCVIIYLSQQNAMIKRWWSLPLWPLRPRSSSLSLRGYP